MQTYSVFLVIQFYLSRPYYIFIDKEWLTQNLVYSKISLAYVLPVQKVKKILESYSAFYAKHKINVEILMIFFLPLHIFSM
jgi:hypothetical protein